MVQEVTTQGWGSRLGNALMGILVGMLLIIGAFVLIFWNESHGLHVAQSLQQTEKVLINVPNTPVEPNNNLKVVYFTGLATTNETLTDALLGISTKAIRLRRLVEMYQWQQDVETTTEKELGGSVKETKTYSYKPVWSDRLIDSSQFKDPTGHQNPQHIPFGSRTDQAQQVTVGAFLLPPSLVSNITNETPVDLSGVNLETLKGKYKLDPQHVDNSIYFGTDPQTPEVGDVRINVFQVIPQEVSVIAQQTGNTLKPYVAPAGQPVAIISTGEVLPEQMIYNEQLQNTTTIWILRLVSLLMMVVGISLLFRPLVVLADVVPVVGSVVGFGTGFISFILGLMLWAIATALAWFVARPLYAIGLVIVVAAICYWLVKRRHRKIIASNSNPVT